MSYRGENHLWKKGRDKHYAFDTNLEGKSLEDIKTMFAKILDQGVHGFCFSFIPNSKLLKFRVNNCSFR